MCSLEYPCLCTVFSGVRVARSLVFCVMFCRSLFVLFHLAIVLSVFRFMASEYPFGTFKLSLSKFLFFKQLDFPFCHHDIQTNDKALLKASTQFCFVTLLNYLNYFFSVNVFSHFWSGYHTCKSDLYVALSFGIIL